MVCKVILQTDNGLEMDKESLRITQYSTLLLFLQLSSVQIAKGIMKHPRLMEIYSIIKTKSDMNERLTWLSE